MEMLKDINGKVSSTRVWGSACMAIGLIMAAGSGFEAFYKADSTAYITVLSIGMALLFGKVLDKTNPITQAMTAAGIIKDQPNP